VQHTTEVVLLRLPALTPWAVMRVSVSQDIPETDIPVKVSQLRCVYPDHIIV